MTVLRDYDWKVRMMGKVGVQGLTGYCLAMLLQTATCAHRDVLTFDIEIARP
jgi:hypothetical protein